MSSPTGFVGWTLETLVVDVATQAPAEKRRELKTLFEGGPGDVQEQLAWRAAGYPVRTYKRSWTFPIANIRDFLDQVEEILAGPGPFAFCFWKYTHHRYISDGARVEFFLPHAGGVATDTLIVPGYTAPEANDRFLPEVKLGLGSTTPLTYSKVDSATYATGPASGAVYFLENSDRFKIASADVPAAGEFLSVRYVPLYLVVEAGDLDRRYPDNAREPRPIELREI